MPNDSHEYGIIFGCPRSGTSFLVRALQALDYSAIFSGDYVPDSIPSILHCDLSEDVVNSLSWGFKHAVDIYVETYKKGRGLALINFLKRNLGFTEFIKTIRKKRKIERAIYKEPFLAFVPEFAYNALPDSRIIYIVRDGRDCANSLISTFDVLSDDKLKSLTSSELNIGRKHGANYIPWWVKEGKESDFVNTSQFVRAVWMWKVMVNICNEFILREDVKASGRILTMKYEDMVRAPDIWSEKIVSHFGAKMNRRLRRNFRTARISSIGKYKKRSIEEIKTAETLARSELELYGYL